MGHLILRSRLVASSRAITEAFAYARDECFVSWLRAAHFVAAYNQGVSVSHMTTRNLNTVRHYCHRERCDMHTRQTKQGVNSLLRV